MEAVMMRERRWGIEPTRCQRPEAAATTSRSRVRARSARLRFIEVKGRVTGATTVTVTKNEILTALNKPDDLILALVEVDGDHGNAAPT